MKRILYLAISGKSRNGAVGHLGRRLDLERFRLERSLTLPISTFPRPLVSDPRTATTSFQAIIPLLCTPPTAPSLRLQLQIELERLWRRSSPTPSARRFDLLRSLARLAGCYRLPWIPLLHSNIRLPQHIGRDGQARLVLPLSAVVRALCASVQRRRRVLERFWLYWILRTVTLGYTDHFDDARGSRLSPQASLFSSALQCPEGLQQELVSDELVRLIGFPLRFRATGSHSSLTFLPLSHPSRFHRRCNRPTAPPANSLPPLFL